MRSVRDMETAASAGAAVLPIRFEILRTDNTKAPPHASLLLAKGSIFSEPCSQDEQKPGLAKVWLQEKYPTFPPIVLPRGSYVLDFIILKGQGTFELSVFCDGKKASSDTYLLDGDVQDQHLTLLFEVG